MSSLRPSRFYFLLIFNIGMHAIFGNHKANKIQNGSIEEYRATACCQLIIRMFQRYALGSVRYFARHL